MLLYDTYGLFELFKKSLFPSLNLQVEQTQQENASLFQTMEFSRTESRWNQVNLETVFRECIFDGGS